MGHQGYRLVHVTNSIDIRVGGTIITKLLFITAL